jgi:hypothetical protein
MPDLAPHLDFETIWQFGLSIFIDPVFERRTGIVRRPASARGQGSFGLGLADQRRSTS